MRCIAVADAPLRLEVFEFTEESYRAPASARDWIIAHKMAMPAYVKLVIKVQSAFPTSVPSVANFSIMIRVWNPKLPRLSAARASQTVFVAANYEFALKRKHSRFLE